MKNIKFSKFQKPLVWEEIRKYHRNPPDYVLCREKKVIISYQRFIDELIEKNLDMNNEMLNRLFSDDTIKCSLQINNFPYWCEGAKHYVLWFHPASNDEFPENLNKIDSSFVEHIVRDKYKLNEYIFYENYYKHRSVNGLKHLHIFIKTSIETEL
uniref:Uncharacterized protein n=1 Tax=viral metagenome TaxID=1070528 RepID=A0A6C0KE81_9ZZZZ